MSDSSQKSVASGEKFRNAQGIAAIKDGQLVDAVPPRGIVRVGGGRFGGGQEDPLQDEGVLRDR